MAFVKILLICASFVAGVRSLELDNVFERLATLEKQRFVQASINKAQETKIKGLENLLKKYAEKDLTVRSSRALQADDHIAFTSFLSQDLDNVAFNSTIIFDSVLLNEGDGYNNATGIFTAPLSGVYYFTYFIGQKDDFQINTMMTVNHVNYVDALAEGISTDHNDQGGNAAVVMLNAGDQVQIKHRHAGNHIEGAPGLRLSTFTGFLMYTKEPISTVDTIIG